MLTATSPLRPRGSTVVDLGAAEAPTAIFGSSSCGLQAFSQLLSHVAEEEAGPSRRTTHGRRSFMDPAQPSSDRENESDALDPTGVLTRLAAVLNSPQTLEMTLTDVVAIAKDSLPGADEVSITLLED